MLDNGTCVRTCRKEYGHGPCAIWKMPGPVRRNMQKGSPRSMLVDDPRGMKFGILVKQSLQMLDVTILDRGHHSLCQRVVMRDAHIPKPTLPPGAPTAKRINFGVRHLNPQIRVSEFGD